MFVIFYKYIYISWFVAMLVMSLIFIFSKMYLAHKFLICNNLEIKSL